jgi:hypothetical protein
MALSRRAAREIPGVMNSLWLSSTQQLRQLGNVRRDPPRPRGARLFAQTHGKWKNGPGVGRGRLAIYARVYKAPRG